MAVGSVVLDGRDAERHRCVQVLDSMHSGTARLELIGDPGIGKSALVDDIVAVAVSRGYRVLRARPSRAEVALAFVGLSDLLLEVTDTSMLTAPEQRALDVALGRSLGDGAPVSTRTLGAGVAAILRGLAADGPTLIAVDDLHWLDAASADVLAFVLRRLPARNIMVLLAHRRDSPTVFGPGDQVEVGPLSADATRRLVTRVAKRSLSRAVLDRIVETAGGSPLFVHELVRSTSSADPKLMIPLPLPQSLNELVADRVTALPAATIEALALSALLGAPTIDALTDLGELDELVPAERAGIVEIIGRTITFTHPMLASAAHDAMPGTQRLRLHRRLAEVTVGLERCIHLALGTDRVDAVVAAELSGAVPGLMARGATAEAAELAVLALSITPADDDERYERMLVCGDALFRAGRTTEALAHLERARVEAPSALIARALLGLATIEYSHIDNPDAAAQLAAQAIGLTEDPALLAEAHTILSRVLYTDFGAAADHAAEALRLMEQIDTNDALALAMALNASATANFMAGRGLDRAMFDRAIELERGCDVSAADSAAGALAALLKYADELDDSRQMLESMVDDADESSLPYVLGHLPQLELWQGRWDEAERCARRQLELANRMEQDSQVQVAMYNLAVVAAFRGLIGDAEPLARALFDEGVSTGALWTERNGAALLGFLAMSIGDADQAVRYLGRYEALGEAMGLHDPGYTRFHGDFVEALVAVGDLDRATAVLDRVEPRALALQRPSAVGWVLRGRALVHAHRGDVEAALDSARAAVAVYEPTSLVYDRARALLTLGIVLRRFKLKAEARAALAPALEMFEGMGARSFVERTRVELGRLGVRAVTSLTLTETERRVAELAAGGRTTRQIADSLFISTKTVEANMTRIYRKLGVSNRAELATLLAAAIAT